MAMAGESVVGALRVILGLDSAQFEDGLKKASGAVGRIAEIFAGVGLERIAERVFGAITESINHAIEAGDKLQKASDKFGIPAENLQVFAHVAELSNVSLDELGSSIAKLTKNMIAAEGPTSAQAAAFKSLGLSVQQLIALRPDEAFLKVAEAIAKFGDGTGKTAAAQAIFGRDAANLLPVLNQIGTGFDELKGRMQDYGQIISGPTLKAAERFKDALTDLGKTKDSIILKIVGDSGLLGAMTSLIEKLNEAGGSSKAFDDNFGPLVDTIRGTITDFENLASAIDRVKTAVKNSNDAALEGTKAWLGYEFGIEGVAEQAQRADAPVVKLGETIAKDAAEFVNAAEGLKAMQAAAAAFKPQLAFSPEQNKNLEDFNKHLEKLKAEAQDASGLFAGTLAPGFLQAAASLELLRGKIKPTDDGFVNLSANAEKLNLALFALQGARLVQETIPAWQLYQQQIMAVSAALEQKRITEEQAANTSQILTAKVNALYAQQADAIVGNMANAFRDLASLNKQYGGIAKTFAIGQALIATYLGANRAYADAALLGGPILGAIAAAAAVAAGLANVAKISATKFALGGSFKVGGGLTHTDTQLVSLALSPGEMVDIRRPESTGGGGVQTINLAGIGPRDLFTGDMLRDLFDALNQGQRDGYKLQVT
jgi:hypothetical protein